MRRMRTGDGAAAAAVGDGRLNIYFLWTASREGTAFGLASVLRTELDDIKCPYI